MSLGSVTHSQSTGTTEVNYDYVFKVVLVGDSGVGKTNILKQYTESRFEVDSKSTIGVEFATKTEKVKGATVKAVIWDTAGQERFRALTSAYYRGASGALVVYDTTDHASFEHCLQWVKDLKEKASRNCIILMVGNKNDLTVKREVTKAEALEFARTESVGFYETSAANGENIRKCFHNLLSQMYLREKRLSASGSARRLFSVERASTSGSNPIPVALNNDGNKSGGCCS